MSKLTWDVIGERRYETGVDRGVLYIPNSSGVYNNGVAWSGLTTVTESPSGAEANAQYADNIKYLNLISAEEFGATIEAFTYPDEWLQFDGAAQPVEGLVIGQQSRPQFGLSYRTRIGNDVEGDNAGYKLHLVYGAQASPSEKAYTTVNDSPEALTFSWEIATTPVEVPNLRPTSIITIDSTKFSSGKMSDLEDILWGTVGSDPRLPLPAELITMMDTGLTLATPTQPVYDNGTHKITIPTITGVNYFADDEPVEAGDITLTSGQAMLVKAEPAPGYKFPAIIDTDWLYEY